MPLIVYASLDLPKAVQMVQEKETGFIDLSKCPSGELAEQTETIRTHQKEQTSIYLGFLDPLFMMTPYHETILRRSIQSCRVVFVCSDPTALSFCWKNGIEELHLVL
jgi:hypothetical protein